jgi:hypothetical protein
MRIRIILMLIRVWIDNTKEISDPDWLQNDADPQHCYTPYFYIVCIKFPKYSQDRQERVPRGGGGALQGCFYAMALLSMYFHFGLQLHPGIVLLHFFKLLKLS